MLPPPPNLAKLTEGLGKGVVETAFERISRSTNPSILGHDLTDGANIIGIHPKTNANANREVGKESKSEFTGGFGTSCYF